MKHSSALTGPLALVFAGGLAMGQTCPFTITHDADSLVTACTEVSTGVWDLSLSITDTDYPEVTVIVNDLPGGVSPAICDLLVTLNNPGGSGHTVGLDLMGPGGDEDNLASLGSLNFATTTGGQLVLYNVHVGGDVKYINAHGISFLYIGGDLVEGIDTHVIDGISTTVNSVVIHGDMLGPISFNLEGPVPPHLYSLIVDGDIGSVDDHFTQYAPLVGVIECDNLIAHLSVLIDMRRLATTGALVGNVYAGNLLALQDTGGTGDPGIFIGPGNLKSTTWVDDGFGRTIELPADICTDGLLRLPSMPVGSSVLIAGTIQDDGGLLLVDGEMAGTISVDGANGLEGQIIINGAGALDPNHEFWSGDVEIDDVTLGPSQSGDYEAPYYGVLSTTLGGGAIGLVPFNLHRKDSSPRHGSTVTTGAPTSVQSHYYGPVLDADDDTSTTPPVKVYEASIQVPIGDGQHSTIPVCDTNI